MKKFTELIIRAAPCLLVIVLGAACSAGVPAGNPLEGPWEYAAGSLDDSVETAAGYRYAPLAKLTGLERLVPGGEGVVWLMKRFTAPDGFRGKRWSLLLGTIVPVDETYLNGEFVGGRGVFPYPGRRFFSDWNRYRRYEISTRLMQEGENRLMVKIYMRHEGSMNGIIALGERSEIEAVFRIQDFIRYHVNLLTGVVLMFSAFVLFFITWLLRPRGLVILHLAASCLLFTCYVLNFIATRLPFDIDRILSSSAFQKIVFGAPCIGFFFLVGYIYYHLDIKPNRALVALKYTITLAPALIALVMPQYFHGVWLNRLALTVCACVTLAYILLLTIRSTLKKNPEARILLYGFVPLIMAVVFDAVMHIAKAREDVIYMSGIGVVAYIILIAGMMANNFVSNYRRFERTNADLALEIEERKKTEDALMAEKELLSVTIDSIAEAVIATDREGRVLILNRVAEDLCGIPLGEIVGKPIQRELAGKNEAMADLFSEVFEEMGEADRRFEIGLHRIDRDSADKKYVLGSSAPIRDRDQRVVGSVFVLRDVTGDMRLQNEILKMRKLESIGLLAGGIAHDFNNILTAILGNINLAKMMLEGDTDPARLMVDAEKAVLRAQGLTRQLLTFAKGGAPVRQVASVQEIIRDSTDFVLRGSNVMCTFNFSEGLWPANVDVGQFSQVIQNLVINADQSMPDGGEIVITTENVVIEEGGSSPLRPGKYVKISVKDEGTGIDAQSLPKIFDPYFTTKRDGSGLGLASSYSIIKKHDGHIEAVSAPGRGSTFHLYLPSSGNPVARDARARPGVVPVRGAVLLMDDDEGVVITVKKMLEHLGLSVVVSLNGEDTIELYRKSLKMKKPFDLVILDLTIPGGIGGKDVIRDLLKMDPGVNAIVSSGYSTDQVMAEYEKYGFKGVISKPYRLEELSQVIRRIMADGQRL